MKKKISIIVGGSGQFGVTLSKQLIKKNHKVIVTTRNIYRAKKKINIINKNLKIVKLDVLKIDQINRILSKFKPNFIFYFAGQSSPGLSFKTVKETYLSNFVGCKNFLELIRIKKLSCKFLNSSSSEIFAKTNKKIDIYSRKKPISPYGKSKLLSLNITKKYREKYKIKSYNAIIFNTESLLRNRNYLIPKICLAAIRAYKKDLKTNFGNLNVAREWNWCEEQVKNILKFLTKKPQDFILSNQKLFTAKDMLNFAFNYFHLDFKNYVLKNRNYLRPDDFKIKKSNAIKSFKSNNIKHNYLIYGKKIIIRLIKFYLHEKKY